MYVCDSLGRRVDGQLIFAFRLCYLFACHVRGILLWVRHLTLSTLRLNSRDSLRDRPPASRSNNGSNPDNGINLSSFGHGYGTKSGPAGVSVTVHRSTNANFVRNKSDNDVEPTFEVPKPVISLRLLATPRLIHIMSAGCKYRPSYIPRSNF